MAITSKILFWSINFYQNRPTEPVSNANQVFLLINKHLSKLITIYIHTVSIITGNTICTIQHLRFTFQYCTCGGKNSRFPDKEQYPEPEDNHINEPPNVYYSICMHTLLQLYDYIFRKRTIHCLNTRLRDCKVVPSVTRKSVIEFDSTTSSDSFYTEGIIYNK